MSRILFLLGFVLALGLVHTIHAADKITLPATPEGTVETICKSLGDQKPQVLWSALPEKYQTDVKEIIELFATNMDKDVYDMGIKTIGKVAKILKDKKSFIANNATVQGMIAANNIKPEDFEKQLEGSAAVMEILLSSDLKSLDSLKSMDPEAFLADTCSKMMKTGSEAAKNLPQVEKLDALQKVKDAKVTVVESASDKAKLKIEINGKEREVPFVKVDNKWIPEDIAEGWERNITKYKDNLKSMKIPAQQKGTVMGIMGAVDGMLGGLEKATTQDEFDQAVMSLVGMAQNFAPRGGGPGRPGAPPPGGPPGFEQGLPPPAVPANPEK